jgi:WD40 repeat protein
MLLLVGLVVASIGALFVAEQQRNDALIAQSRFLARDSHAATTAGDATLGQLLALEALPHSVSQPDRPFLLEAEGALEDALANRRERSVLLGHEGPIRVVSFSPAGKRLLTGSDDGTAWLWDIAAGTTIVVLRGHGAAVTGAAFSPDGKRVITGSKDGTARLWNAETGAPLAVLEGHERPVLCVAFSPNGSRVATTSEDSTARL